MPRITINAKDVVNDIQAGVDDAGLMAKYGLSPQWMTILFSKLVEAGLITQRELDRRSSRIEWSALMDTSDLSQLEDTNPVGEFEKTVDLSELYPRENMIPDPSLAVETVNLGEPTETVKLTPLAQRHAQPQTDHSEGFARFSQEPQSRTVRHVEPHEDAIKALEEFAQWWQKAKPALRSLGVGAPRFKKGRVVARTLKLNEDIVRAAEEKAAREKALTGGDLASLIEILLWEYIGKPQHLIQM
jgi:hypothetical protein